MDISPITYVLLGTSLAVLGWSERSRLAGLLGKLRPSPPVPEVEPWESVPENGELNDCATAYNVIVFHHPEAAEPLKQHVWPLLAPGGEHENQ